MFGIGIKKRCIVSIFILLALLLMAIPVFGVTVEFDDKIVSGESIDIDDFTFIITMNKYASAIFVDAGQMYATVQLYQCGRMEHFRVCFDNTTYDEEENELYAEVRILRYEPDLSITRTANQTEFYVGQEAEITITITNTGDGTEQVLLTDDYPVSMMIYDLEGGCQEHENQVYWKGHLDGNETRQCRFIIKPTKELEQSLVAHMQYWDGFKWEEEYSTALNFKITSVLEVLTSVVREDYEVDGQTFDYEEEPDDIYIGEVLRLVINVTNNHPSERIDVDKFEITLPPDLEYMSTGYLRFVYTNSSGNKSSKVWNSDSITKISSSILRWSGYVAVNKSRGFIIKLKSKRTGSQNVLFETKYEYDDFEFRDTAQETFDVVDPGIGIRMTVLDQSRRFSAPERLDQEDDNIEIEALHPYKITVYTQNRNKFAELRDVNIKVYTAIANFTQVHYAEIAKEGQKIPYSTVMIPPNPPHDRKYTLNISIRYTNEFGETNENSTEFDFDVKRAKDITINQDSSEGDVLEGGEETEIIVEVGNDRLVDIRDVTVKDTIDPALHVEGVHSKKLKLIKDDETIVYKYRVKVPVVHNKTKYNITTVVSFFDPDLRYILNYSEVLELTVKPLQPSLSIDVTLDEPDPIYPGAMIPAEYTIGNDEATEVIRDITVRFPIEENFDLVGPRTIFIDKLDPGEEYTIADLIKIRPKQKGTNIKINKTRADYFDNYGNPFHENSSMETIDVDPGRINGPELYIRTVVPDVVNKSTEDTIKLVVSNNGTAAADATIQQGSRIWNITIGADSTKTVEYTVNYDEVGNYTLPEPYATFKIQGLEAHTKGRGANVTVKMILGPSPEEEKVKEAVKKEEVPEKEKEEMSFEEYERIAEEKFVKRMIRYGIVGLIAIIFFVVILFYIGYQRRKAPIAPIMETEE